MASWRWPVLARAVSLVLTFVMMLGLSVSPSAALAMKKGEVVAHTASGPHRFTVEWAVTPEQRERGLMARYGLAADHGMMFDFGVEAPVVFWMKNTPLPLDMIFVAADGTVRRIAARTKPYSLDMVPSGAPVRYVLEIGGGIAARIGLVPGDRIEIVSR